MNVVNQGDGHELSATVTAVAVDGEKNSQQAVKWTVDHLLIGHYSFILLHVKPKTIINHGFSIADTTNEGGQEQQEQDMTDLFLPFRGFCARRGVKIIEVVLEDDDVSKAIADYINNNQVHNIVVGASNRNMFTKKFRNPDVPSNLIKMAPEFCAVYVISKGKPLTVRSAKGPLPATTARPPLLASTTSNFREMDDAVKTPFGRANSQSMAAPSGPSSVPDRTSGDRNMYYAKTPSRDRPFPGNMPTNMIAEHSDAPYHYTNPSASHDGFSAYMDFQRGVGFNSMDMDSFKLSTGLPDSPRDSHLPTNELEAEMRRLKLELKQTMDMYNNACKEAISAKQKTRELEQWQAQEARRLEQARQAEEAALAIAEMEKARAKAAIETAEAAKRIAQLEAQKRQSAEMKAKREAEEKTRALDALAQNDVRYRKYSIEEIEIATDYFAEKLKIGEGGYGPVYRACLDHTPVAIKVLRPDAAQGRKQFQQEVEVLSCIRHPNMVLLLGACPEYGCLVYEYMDNGSLEDRLYRRGNTPSIPWSTRFKIAAEIATGLLFLHQTKPEPLVHRDLKPANILLDRNYVSKISDVGLARLVPPSVANSVTQYRLTSTAGTFCYIDPEYQQTGMLGIKSDIYSLGILLLQIITGRPPMGLAHHVERAIEKGVFAEILDPSVKDWPVEEALSFAKIAIKCSELKRKDRPDLGTVILPELNRLRNLGHAFEASLMGGSGSAIISFSGLPQSFPLSSSSGSHQIQQHSLQNQEKMMTSSNDAISWKSTSDASGR